MPARAAWPLVVGAIALAARAGFVAVAPDEVFGDPSFYVFYAQQILAGNGFTESDGSPGIFWMPGWPAWLAFVLAVSGGSVRAAVWTDVVLGAATSVLIALLAARIAGRRSGIAAGLVHALWPGNIYLTAVLLVETFFNFLLSASLLALAAGLDGGRPRRGPLLVAGLAFAGMAMVKAEPLVLVPVLAATVVLALPRRARAPALATLLVPAGIALGVWTVRNLAHFGRPIVTSASGGTNFWIGNHRGASGGNDLPVEAAFRALHRRETFAATNLAQNDAGWREGLAFVRAHPGEALALLPKKLRLTYASDTAARGNLRPLPPERRRRLEQIADPYWFGVLALAAIGLGAVRGWPPAHRVLVVGPLVAWLLVQLVFVGGPRFHAPQTPSLAVLAGAGAVRAIGAARGLARVARRRWLASGT